MVAFMMEYVGQLSRLLSWKLKQITILLDYWIE